MTSDERADWLARAIDEILRHGEPPEAPEGMDEAEVASLLDAARLRRDAADSARRASVDHEAKVWERLVERLESSENATATRKSRKRTKGPPADEDGELRQVIALRMQVAREALEMAEEHRDEVWERLKSRLGATEHASALQAKLDETPVPVPPPSVPERRRMLQGQEPIAAEEPSRTQRWAALPFLAIVSVIVIAAVVATAIVLI